MRNVPLVEKETVKQMFFPREEVLKTVESAKERRHLLVIPLKFGLEKEKIAVLLTGNIFCYPVFLFKPLILDERHSFYWCYPSYCRNDIRHGRLFLQRISEKE